MGAKNLSAGLGQSEITVRNAVWIVIATAPLGFLVGMYLTVHVVSPVTLAVWLTTIGFTLFGFLLWSTWLATRKRIR